MQNTSHDLRKLQVLLKYTYGLVPIIAGADKFANLLTNWSVYLPSSLANALPFSAQYFLMVVGVIEVIAGLLVFIKPQKGAYLVCVWLVLIAISLVAGKDHFDVAVRDLVMAIGAFTLAKLSQILE